MTFLGINANNILNKIHSFENWLIEKDPQISAIQETKVPSIGLINSVNTRKYQLYEQIRSVNPGMGGGLCIGVKKELPSTLIREGGEDVECLTVQVEVGQQELLIVCGYGPQENAGTTRKEDFWQYLEREVDEATREEKMLVIQMDSNAWLGRGRIPGDPNQIQNSNGKMFSSFLERNQNISLVNALSVCEGIITRQRKTDLLDEKSALDVFLVCERVLPFVTKMFIDEKRESPLTNFSNLIRRKKITETDHNKLELFLSIKAPFTKPKREELFNFKTKHGQFLFKNHSSNSKTLQNCFKTDRKLEDQALTFEKEINNIFHQSFQKIRGTKRKKENQEIDLLLNERKRIKMKTTDPKNKTVQNELEKVDKTIAKLISDQNRNKINKIFLSIANSEDSCNTLGMWKQVKKIFPKVLKSVPSGIKKSSRKNCDKNICC